MEEKNGVEDWVPPLPNVAEHWEIAEFEDLLQNVSTNGIKIPQKSYLPEGQFPVIDQGQNLIGGFTNDTDKVLENLGSVVVFGDHTRCFKQINFAFAPGADGVKILKPVPEVDPKFIYYSLKTVNLPNRGYSRHYSFLKKSKLPLCSLNEQKRIVAKIEALFSELDKGIENLKTAQAQLQIYRQAILKNAFEGKLTSTQSKWRETSLGLLTNLVTSGSRGWAKYYSDTGDLFIRAQNLKYDRLDLTEKAYVEIPNKTEGTRTQTQKNDLLITITGANVTKSALIKNDIGTAYVSQHVALCRPTKEVLPTFLYWFVVAETAGRKQLNKAAYGAGKPGLNLNNIKSVKLSIPAYEEQIDVVEAIEEKLSVCSQFEQDIEIALNSCNALRQSILKKAFSGQLVAQDPTDEPASILLERIKAEKEKSSKTKKRNSA